MKKMSRRALAATGFALFCAASPVLAQEPLRLRGTVERVDGPVLVVKTRDGAEQKLTLTDKPIFVAIVTSTVADIKPGMFLGSTALPQPDGRLRTTQCHIF